MGDMVGERIRQAREMRGWTVGELARRIRRATGAASPKELIVSQYEESRRSPSPQTLRVMARVLDVSESWLGTGSEALPTLDSRVLVPVDEWEHLLRRVRELELRLSRIENGR